MKKFKSVDNNHVLNTISNNKSKENVLFKDLPFNSIPLANQKLDDIIRNEKFKYYSLFGEKSMSSMSNDKSKFNQKSKNTSQTNYHKLTKTLDYDKKNEIYPTITINDSNTKFKKYILNVEKTKTQNTLSPNSTIDYTKFQKFNSPSRNIISNNNKLTTFYSKNNIGNLYNIKNKKNKRFYTNSEDNISFTRTYNKLNIKNNLNILKPKINKDKINSNKQSIPTSTNATNTISNKTTDNFSSSNNLFFITNLNSSNDKKRTRSKTKTNINLYQYFFEIKNLENNYETKYKNLINNIKEGKIEVSNRVKKWERRLNRMNRKNNYDIEKVVKLENDEDLKQIVLVQKNLINNFIENFGQKSQKNFSETEKNNKKIYTNKYVFEYLENFSKDKINYDLISIKHKNFKKMIEHKRQELVKANKYISKLIAKNKNYSDIKRKKTIKIGTFIGGKYINKNKTPNNNKDLEN